MEKRPYPSETQERFIVRLPDGMRDLIAQAALANNRSMNAEIVARLQGSFASPLDRPLPVLNEAQQAFASALAASFHKALDETLDRLERDGLDLRPPDVVARDGDGNKVVFEVKAPRLDASSVDQRFTSAVARVIRRDPEPTVPPKRRITLKR